MRIETGGLTLRPLRMRDRHEWDRVRSENMAWLSPWEGSSPDPTAERPGFREYVRTSAANARRGTGWNWVLELDGAIVGQITLSSVIRGSLCSGNIGYWVARSVAGRGLMPRAVAAVTDFAFFTAGLHRVEVNIRPENAPSLRVVEKLGFREEGLRERFLHIDGDWRDHRSFALTREEAGAGLSGRLA